MRKSQFLGVTILNPGEGLDADNYAFTGRDRELIDYGVRIGAKLHRHNALDGMADPAIAPSGVQVVASGGAIPTGATISVGYTFEDSIGGETALSPTVSVATGQPLAVPTVAPTAVVDYASGALTTGSYYYAVSWLDGEGGETPVGPTVVAERQPGFEHAAVHLTNLNAGIAGASASGYRLYRAVGGGSYELLAERAASASSFVDDGNQAVNCDVHPVADATNNTRQNNTLKAILPAKPAAQDTEPVAINLYASLGNDFAEASLLAQYPIASAGQPVSFTRLEVLPASPPDRNTSFGGANKIDPDTDLLDWHWKRPVATKADLPEGAEAGDARVALDTGTIYVFTGSAWNEVSGSGGGGSLTVAGSGSYIDTFDGALEWRNDFGNLGSTLEVAGGALKPSKEIEGTGQFIVPGAEEEDPFLIAADQKVVFAFHTGATPKGTNTLVAGVRLKNTAFLGSTRYIEATLVSSEGISGFELHGGEGTYSGAVAPDLKPFTWYWFEASVVGNKMSMTVYEDPGPRQGGAVVFHLEEFIASEDQAKYGAGVAGIFEWWLPPVASDWSWDSFSWEERAVTGATDIVFEGPVTVRSQLPGIAEVKVEATGGKNVMGVVWCGEDLTLARPEGFDAVTWITQGKGEEEPEHMAVHDLLYALP